MVKTNLTLISFYHQYMSHGIVIINNLVLNFPHVSMLLKWEILIFSSTFLWVAKYSLTEKKQRSKGPTCGAKVGGHVKIYLFLALRERWGSLAWDSYMLCGLWAPPFLILEPPFQHSLDFPPLSLFSPYLCKYKLLCPQCCLSLSVVKGKLGFGNPMPPIPPHIPIVWFLLLCPFSDYKIPMPLLILCIHCVPFKAHYTNYTDQYVSYFHSLHPSIKGSQKIIFDLIMIQLIN